MSLGGWRQATTLRTSPTMFPRRASAASSHLLFSTLTSWFHCAHPVAVNHLVISTVWLGSAGRVSELRIFFNGRLKRGLQGKSEGPRRQRSDQTTKKGGREKQSFHRCVSFAGGCTTSATCLPRRSLDCWLIFGLNSSPSGFVAQARASLATAALCK